MAIAPNANIDCQAAGSPTNGGFFDGTVANAGIDHSLSTSPIVTLTDVACTQNSTTITSATGEFTTALIGNGVWFSAGTNFITTTPRYVVSVESPTSLTLDSPPATAGNCSGGNMKIGGCWASPTSGQWSNSVGGCTWWYKSQQTYTLTGTLSVPANPTGALKINMKSYTTTHGDFVSFSNIPKLACGNSYYTLSSSVSVEGLWIDGTRSGQYTLVVNNGSIINCKVTNTSNNSSSGALSFNSTIVYGCDLSATYGNAVYANTGTIVNSFIHDSLLGVTVSSGQRVYVMRTIFKNTTTCVSLNSAAVYALSFIESIFYNFTSGIVTNGSKFHFIEGCIFHTGTSALTDSINNPSIVAKRNIFYNVSTNGNNIALDSTNMQNTDPLFVDPNNNDFSVKNGSPALLAGYNFFTINLPNTMFRNIGIDQYTHRNISTASWG